MSKPMQDTSAPVVLINVFIPRPGKLDEFIALQAAAIESFKGRVPGSRGSRLHRALDGSSAVMMSTFDSVESHRRWQQSAEFVAHRERVQPLIERVEPCFYTVAHTTDG